MKGNSNTFMNDWEYAQTDPSEQLARLHYFSVKKVQEGTDIEMHITVREYVTPPMGGLQFFAQADKETNQKVAPYRPAGWGGTMLEALGACMREINRFPYQPVD
jgi:hypothetical protein